MKKVKTIVPIALACTTIIAFFSLGATVSYLTDAEATDNIITIGKVALTIEESSYTDNQIVAAGGSVTKNPTIKNTESKDEYVFFRVGVPKRNVTLLYEAQTTDTTVTPNKTYGEGTPTKNNYENGNIVQKKDEIYKIIADGVNGTTSTAVSAELTDNAEPKAEPQLYFYYNKGDSTTTGSEKAGWIYLKRELNQVVNEGTTESPKNYYYDYYYFGYNKKLAKGKGTIPLFDRIQLKSFIDEEVNSKDTNNNNNNKPLNEETQIKIDAYGIQADSLGGDLNSLDEFVSKENLVKIFNIVKEKKG